MSDATGGAPGRRLGRGGLGIRVLVGALTVVGVTAGTVVGTDDWWPFAPMNQYSFTVGNSGTISSRYIEAVTDEGRLIRVPLDRNLGLERAEIEGQLTTFVKVPSTLQAVAVVYHRRHPDGPRLTSLYLRNRITTLPARTVEVVTLSVWQVVDPDDPQELR